jgi:hypothetical protein
MRNPAKANLMGKAGRELVLKNQVWPAVAEKIINRIERELLSFRPA